MTFEEQMRSAQSAHLAKDYDMALAIRLQAFDGADNDINKGRAARDVAASLDRIGLTEPAEEWAFEAWNIHNDAFISGQKDALRERAPSAMYVGSIALRNAIHEEMSGVKKPVSAEKALNYLNMGLYDITKYEELNGGIIDQYRINIISRLALAEVLYGSKPRARRLSFNGMAIAPLSDSCYTSTYDRSVPVTDRMKARFNAGARGLGALSVASLPFEISRPLALAIANKIL